jgi:hypothetical protein
MKVVTNKCPSCGKRAGLVSVGSDFEHVIGERETTEVKLTPKKSVANGAETTGVAVSAKKVKKPITLKGPGSLCTKCGWSRRDILSTHYSASCGDCSDALGQHAHLEMESPKKHFCQECSAKRVQDGKHDPDDAVVTFPIPCAGGCGKIQAHLSWPEGDIDALPENALKEYFCSGQKCQDVLRRQREVAVNAEKISRISSSGGTIGSPSEIFPSKVQ